MAIDRCVAQAASARAGVGGVGRGSAASGGGAPVAEVKKHRPAKGHSGVA